MKKLLAVLSISLFVFAGCQESSSIVAPNNDSTLDKEKQEKFVTQEEDGPEKHASATNPSFPRL